MRVWVCRDLEGPSEASTPEPENPKIGSQEALSPLQSRSFLDENSALQRVLRKNCSKCFYKVRFWFFNVSCVWFWTAPSAASWLDLSVLEALALHRPLPGPAQHRLPLIAVNELEADRADHDT